MSRRRSVLRAAEAVFPLAPRLSMGLAAWAAPRLDPHPGEKRNPHLLDPSLIRELLGPLPKEEMDRLLRRNAAARIRGIVLRHAIERRGLDCARPLLRWTEGSLERLGHARAEGRGLCLTTWHAGPTLGLWAGLAQLGLPLLKFQVGERFPSPAGWTCIDPDREGALRAGAMKRALRHLRQGGCVAIPADMYQWSTRAVLSPCLGRQAAFSRAIPALVELSGAPVIPLFAWWGRGGRTLELEVQQELAVESAGAGPSPEFETVVARELAGRVEAYLRVHLDEYDAHYARMFVAHPPIASPPVS